MGLNVKEMSPLKFKCVRNEEYRWYLQMEGFMEIAAFWSSIVVGSLRLIVAFFAFIERIFISVKIYITRKMLSLDSYDSKI